MRAKQAGFLGGVLVAEIANNALHIAQPLLIYELTHSFGKAALFTSGETLVHMAGTAAAGWPCDRLGSRRVLFWSTILRGCALAAIPLLWSCGRLTLGLAAAAYTADAFIRGAFDTAVHALPMGLAEGQAERDRLNARYELCFDLGAVAGPSLLAVIMARASGFAANALVPFGFLAGALAFLAIPASADAASGQRARTGTFEGLRLLLKDRGLLISCLGLASFNLYPLRKLVAAFFAKALLGDGAAAGWLGAAFGLGGVCGSLLYDRRGARSRPEGWILLGALGALALAFGWIPEAFWPMSACVFAFSLTNVCARLALTRKVQERTPVALAGGVTAVTRAASNLSSVGIKAVVGAAFALGASGAEAFTIVGLGLTVLAVVQLALASAAPRQAAVAAS